MRWLWLLVTGNVVGLRLETSAWSLYHDWSGPELQSLFGCLSLERDETQIALIELLNQNDILLQDDYARHRVNGRRARLLVEEFIDWPEVHPLVMPFSLYSSSLELQEELRPVLNKYRPGVLQALEEFHLDQIMCQDLQVLLESARVRLNLWGSGLTAAALRCKLDVPWEISLPFWDSSLDLDEWVGTFGEILPPLDAFYYGTLAASGQYQDCLLARHQNIPSGQPENIDKRGLFERVLVDFRLNSGWSTWYEFYNSLLQVVKQETQALDPTLQALWHAKLVIGALHSTYKKPSIRIGVLKRIAIMEGFLNSHQIKDIPAFLLPILCQCQLTLDPEAEQRLRLKLAELDVAVPAGPRFWGGLPGHSKRWLHYVRSVDRAEISAPACNPCTLMDIERWLGRDAGGFSGQLFFNPQNFPTITLKLRAKKLVSCASLKVFLTELSHMYERDSAMLDGDPDYGQHIADSARTPMSGRALARTLAMNILYRHTLGIAIDRPHVIGALYEGGGEGGALIVYEFLRGAQITRHIPMRLLSSTPTLMQKRSFIDTIHRSGPAIT